MRLSSEEIMAIKETIRAVDAHARIYLFGSRVDNSGRGGDIDLLILSDTIGLMDKIRIKTRLYKAIGEQKIDIIIARDTSKAFVRIAIDEGIQL